MQNTETLLLVSEIEHNSMITINEFLITMSLYKQFTESQTLCSKICKDAQPRSLGKVKFHLQEWQDRKCTEYTYVLSTL